MKIPIGVVNETSSDTGISTGVLDLRGGGIELLRVANVLLVSLTFALLALGCFSLIGEANLFPKVDTGSLEESPRKVPGAHS